VLDVPHGERVSALHRADSTRDPLNGTLFDLFNGYRPLFLVMAGYTTLAFITVLLIPRGTGEAETGPDQA
jgi:hypothetical protein